MKPIISLIITTAILVFSGSCGQQNKSNEAILSPFSPISFEPIKYGQFTSQHGLIMYNDSSHSFIQISANWNEETGLPISYSLIEDRIADDWSYVRRVFEGNVDPIATKDSLLRTNGLLLVNQEIKHPASYYSESISDFPPSCKPIGGKWCTVTKVKAQSGHTAFIGFSTAKSNCMYEHLQWIEMNHSDCLITEIPTSGYGSLESWIRVYYSAERQEEIIFICSAFPEKNGSATVKVIRRKI